MSGKFENAPLIYVTALIKTSTLPSLKADQAAEIEQHMVSAGLIHHKTSSLTTFAVKFDASGDGGAEPAVSKSQDERARHGYFSNDNQEALIISPSGFEWRTCKYDKYSSLRESFSKHLSSLIDIVSAYGEVMVEEVVLSYADVICPLGNRTLADYFSRSESILPLAMFEDKADLQQTGVTQVTRIVNPKQKITITIEQLPTHSGQVNKFIPDILAEPDRMFGQPFTIKEDWQQERPDRKDYALLLTQSAAIPDCQLKTCKDRDLFGDTHTLTSDLFWSLINRDVCNVDWQFTSNGSTQ